MQCSRHSYGASKGFTLIEILVALCIFALMGLAGYQILHTMTQSQLALQKHHEKLAQLQKAMMMVERDILQVSDRSVRLEYGDVAPALTSQSDYKIALSHVGWRNPLGLPRSNIQRVAYDVKNSQLVRLYWGVLDRAQDSKPKQQILLDDVADVKFRFLNNEQQWLETWPMEKSTNITPDASTLPVAIEVILTLKSTEKLQRDFVIRDVIHKPTN